MSKTKTDNGAAETPTLPVPRKAVVTDPTLKLAAKLDRALAEMPPAVQRWAIAWLTAKYCSQEG